MPQCSSPILFFIPRLKQTDSKKQQPAEGFLVGWDSRIPFWTPLTSHLNLVHALGRCEAMVLPCFACLFYASIGTAHRSIVYVCLKGCYQHQSLACISEFPADRGLQVGPMQHVCTRPSSKGAHCPTPVLLDRPHNGASQFPSNRNGSGLLPKGKNYMPRVPHIVWYQNSGWGTSPQARKYG